MRWYPAACACGAAIGEAGTHDVGRPQAWTTLRLAKYAVRIDGCVRALATGALIARRSAYTLAHHISAQLLELSQAHAAHRFVLESDDVRLLVWLFNPSVCVAFAADVDLDGLAHAVAVLYRAEPTPADVEAFTRGHTIERVALPAAVVRRLAATLAASTALYPPSCRRVDALDVGLLARL